MGNIAGRDGTVEVSTNGSSYTAVGDVTDYGISDDGETIDITSFDNNGWRDFISGLSTCTGSISFFYDEADAGQDIIRTSNEGRTKIYYRIRPAGTGTGNREFICQGIITSMEDPSAAVDGAAECSVSIQFCGEPTRQDQS